MWIKIYIHIGWLSEWLRQQITGIGIQICKSWFGSKVTSGWMDVVHIEWFLGPIPNNPCNRRRLFSIIMLTVLSKLTKVWFFLITSFIFILSGSRDEVKINDSQFDTFARTWYFGSRHKLIVFWPTKWPAHSPRIHLRSVDNLNHSGGPTFTHYQAIMRSVRSLWVSKLGG